MDIRDTGMLSKYNEAKEFIKWYEEEKRKCHKPDKFYYVKLYRKQIESFKKNPDFPPYIEMIKNRRQLIKDELKKIYGKN